MKSRKPTDLLARARTSPKAVKHLCLNPGALSHSKIVYEPTLAFPREVLACTNLESLDLFRGIAWDGDNSIPKEIGKLRKLTSLTLGGLSMKTLPDSIGDLSNLRELSLDYAESLRELPKTIGELKKLEKLGLAYTPALKSLPKSIGALGKLQELSCGESGLEQVPAEVWSLRGLKSLALPETVVALPPGIGRLASLEELLVSAKALASVAKELPALKALRALTIHQADSAKLPDEIGRLPELAILHVAFAGLKALPASLAGHPTLEELDVCGNALTDLEALVASLPKLRHLEFSDNPLDRAQKRRIDALMKLPPSKRRANAPIAAAPKHQAPIFLGKVMSINASLLMVIADARVAASWRGAAQDEEGDYERLMAALSADDHAPIHVGGAKALGLSLGVGQGIAHVYRAGEAIVLVEGFFKDAKDPSFIEDVSAPPAKGAKKVGNVEVPSGKLVVTPGTDACEDVAKLSKQKLDAKTGVRCGEERSGLMIAAKGRYDVWLETERHASWGSAARAVLLPGR